MCSTSQTCQEIEAILADEDPVLACLQRDPLDVIEYTLEVCWASGPPPDREELLQALSVLLVRFGREQAQAAVQRALQGAQAIRADPRRPARRAAIKEALAAMERGEEVDLCARLAEVDAQPLPAGL